MKTPRIRFGRPQQIAALVLLVLLAECLWVLAHQRLTEADYSYARCGREMWERPNAVPGYFTTCGNMDDGTLAYRVAAFPLTVQRLVLRAADHFRAPENRTGESTEYELRHEMKDVLLLEHLPFVFFAIWLGGGLWWVSRRLFGNEGGALALAFYCLNPAVIRMAIFPNNDILAAWGLYGTVYTAIGVAHAMHSPPRTWRPRVVLLAIALGLTACAHLLAAVAGLVASLVLMLYLAQRNRGAVMAVLGLAIAGATAILFASYDFSPLAFGYVIRGGAARFWFSLEPAAQGLLRMTLAPTLLAMLMLCLIYATSRRSRFFGNTVPLVMAALLLVLLPTGTQAQAWFWAVPFALTFLGGIWADLLESRQRKIFLGLAMALVAAQTLVTALWLRG